MISVDMIVRSDALSKGGGDMIQVDQYRKHLPTKMFDVRIVPFHPTMALRDGALVHVVNVDRPFDFVLATSAARGRPMIVSPIHHDLAAVRRMRSAERGLGARSLVGRLLSESGREWAATCVRSLKQRSSTRDAFVVLRTMLGQVRRVSRVWSDVGRALDDAHSVFLLAPGEGRSLSRDTGWKGQNSALVPNGSPFDSSRPEGKPWLSRDIDLIVVGRVEPRKRTLDLVRLAAARGVDITVVGPLHAHESPFGMAFRAAVEQSPTVTWTGPKSSEEVLELMGRSKVLANASWVEVQSLVELEAAHLGCYVVSSGTGHTSDWIPASVSTAEDDDLVDLLERAVRLATSPTGPGAVAYPHTWASVTAQVADAYVAASETILR
ncbi:glycosyltransferase [Frigoribacterium sp. RIT-PI-h]|uniref:glycosyltransferase n=1 Tax=Frigoribacterium sp. RIT-PI-h TaxID=1690245 RepID=UPI0006B974C4|nr:glycosyltransferase [Frigoribacterium sp. RIT-PI-h]KPG79364.1 hypothetical protein AEQ27_13955 [Frigoribacterium sp. RIT-PI-h]